MNTKTLSEALYQQWDSEFNVRALYSYFEGRQHRGEQLGIPKSVYNLVYSTLETKIAGLLVGKPKYEVKPLPGQVSFNLEQAVKTANLRADLLNALVSRPQNRFNKEIERAVRDSFFAFGILEVGFSADFGNPESALSIETEDGEEENKDYKKARKQKVNPLSQVFCRRIKHWRFRVSDDTAEDLESVEWCGYYFYTNAEKLEAAGFKLPADHESRAIDVSAKIGAGARQYSRGLKCWMRWNNVTKKRYVMLDGEDDWDKALEEIPFYRLPFAELRWTERSRGFYPVPPISQWISAQNEVNESRQQMKQMRKAAIQRWAALEGSIDQPELDKFLEAEDPTVIFVKRADAIQPIPVPNIPSSVKEGFVLGMDEFNTIAGTSAEQRGQVDRQTATAAKITAQAGAERQDDVRKKIRRLYEDVGRLELDVAIENLDVQLQVILSGTPADQLLGNVEPDPNQVGQLNPAELNDGNEYEIELAPIQDSPLQAQADKEAFLTFLAIVQQSPMISMSPMLIREAAYRVGYRNERIIQQMQQIAQLQLIQQQMGQGGGDPAGGGGGNSDNIAKRQVAQQTPNNMEQIRAQIQNQVGGN